mmetsp:Transcript_97163/g.308229  ORF Transcript_97163/g.308229 Transcript_97163/m.308229 type:complete len:201 (-) Transcript_97163:768-1370(-)
MRSRAPVGAILGTPAGGVVSRSGLGDRPMRCGDRRLREGSAVATRFARLLHAGGAQRRPERGHLQFHDRRARQSTVLAKGLDVLLRDTRSRHGAERDYIQLDDRRRGPGEGVGAIARPAGGDGGETDQCQCRHGEHGDERAAEEPAHAKGAGPAGGVPRGGAPGARRGGLQHGHQRVREGPGVGAGAGDAGGHAPRRPQA